MPRIEARSSSVQSRLLVAGLKRIPVGVRTAWAATSLAASRYLPTISGDITSAWPTFVKPSPAAPSAGNSRPGSSDATPVRSRIVAPYSKFDRRRRTTGPGSPAVRPAIARSSSRIAARSVAASSRDGCGAPGGGMAPARS